jgi:hypothetical protein
VFGLVALVALLDLRALHPPPLLQLAVPGVDGLFGDDGVIEAAVIAENEPAQGAVLELAEGADIAPQAHQLRQDRVIVRQRGGRQLMP